MDAKLRGRLHGFRLVLTGRPGLAGRVLLFALLGFAAGDLPVLVHGAQTSWVWSCCSAIACGAARYAAAAWRLHRCVRGTMLFCIVVTSAGAALDFSRVPPEAILYLCGAGQSAGFGWDQLLGHLRWFPVTMMAMLALIVFRRGGVPHGARRGRTGAALLTALRIALEFGAMSVLMALGMSAMEKLALGLGVPWVANGMVCAMLTGMLAFLLLSNWVAETLALGAARARALRSG